jgi:transcriptional regulator with XRE-family HTH domain
MPAILTNRRVFDSHALRRLRRAAGLSRDQLAHLAEMTTSSVGKYERGERMPRADSLGLLASALGCSVNDLFRDAR